MIREEAIEKIKSWDFLDDNEKEVLETLIPELAESEDEKISREITEFILTHRIDEPNDIEDTNSWLAWLEKQGKQKEYTFKSLPRLLDMIEPTSKAKVYCQKLIDTLVKEGYATDAKIVGECLKKMNGEKVALATMDEKQDPILQRLDRIYDLLLHKLNEKIIINNPFPRLTETPYKPGEVWCGSSAATSEKGGEE